MNHFLCAYCLGFCCCCSEYLAKQFWFLNWLEVVIEIGIEMFFGYFAYPVIIKSENNEHGSENNKWDALM